MIRSVTKECVFTLLGVTLKSFDLNTFKEVSGLVQTLTDWSGKAPHILRASTLLQNSLQFLHSCMPCIAFFFEFY